MPFDWKRPVIYVHRWLGIAGCLLFITWFISGVVMMYARMPALGAAERVRRLATIPLSDVTVSPADAARSTGMSPRAVRLTMRGGRPVYRFAGADGAVFADTGEAAGAVDREQALVIARRLAPDHGASIAYDTYLTDADQWTLSSSIRRQMPLHRIALGDAEKTELYISESTGEAVMQTTRAGRLWAYPGAVLHWLYFTPFRRQAALWAQSIIWLSIAGCVMCASGLVWGLWRYSPSARFRLKRERSKSPYAGMMRWHHYAGLFFGLTTFTWIFSGLLSMDPWAWSGSTSPTREQREGVAGGPLRLDAITLPQLMAAGAAAAGFEPKEIEITQFRGEPLLLVRRAHADAIEQRLVSLAAPGRGAFAQLDREAVAGAARAAMPDTPVEDAVWLDAYDSYYYDRDGELTLPVLRVRYGDSAHTWLYLDPRSGAIVRKEERLSRLNRWLYHGLHSLDFPFLYYRRPLWDAVLIALSIGGLVSSATTLLPALRRLRRHVRRWTA